MRLVEELAPAVIAQPRREPSLGVARIRRARAARLHTARRESARPIRSTGLWRNLQSLDAVNTSPRKRFTRLSVRTFWADCLWREPWGKFDSPDECLKDDCCFACGMYWGVPTDRSHIVARMWGGQDELANLHLLCLPCHDMSEGRGSLAYWRGFRRQHAFMSVSWGMWRMLCIYGIDPLQVALDWRDMHVLAIAYVRRIRPVYRYEA